MSLIFFLHFPDHFGHRDATCEASAPCPLPRPHYQQSGILQPLSSHSPCGHEPGWTGGKDTSSRHALIYTVTYKYTDRLPGFMAKPSTVFFQFRASLQTTPPPTVPPRPSWRLGTASSSCHLDWMLSTQAELVSSSRGFNNCPSRAEPDGGLPSSGSHYQRTAEFFHGDLQRVFTIKSCRRRYYLKGRVTPLHNFPSPPLSASPWLAASDPPVVP